MDERMHLALALQVASIPSSDGFEDPRLPPNLAGLAPRGDFSSHFHDETLRLAGPVFHTPADPARLTIVAEHRADAKKESWSSHYLSSP